MSCWSRRTCSRSLRMPCSFLRLILRLLGFMKIKTNSKFPNQMIKKFHFLKGKWIIKILIFWKKILFIKVKLRVYHKSKKISCLVLLLMPLMLSRSLVMMRASVKTNKKKQSLRKWTKNGYDLLNMMKLSSLISIMKHKSKVLILPKLILNNSHLFE